ncbi:MAG: hypothetical protein RMK64_07970 [Rhodovarius sp.]|nr:hypothetical protein [Rhodovarius sp.]MCX7933348.1 hypothetical protein [Rhodovarius sp.]MDW8314891.1 hypothetical protein [Rhodovarius sp.]
MPAAPRPQRHPVLRHAPRTEPFASAEEAWFWTMAALIARQEGARILAGVGRIPRPCEPDDVLRCLDRLYRQRRIDLEHARVLRRFGERGIPPNPRYPEERTAHRLWQEALSRLEWPLRVKGIVAGGPAA